MAAAAVDAPRYERTKQIGRSPLFNASPALKQLFKCRSFR